MSPVYEQGNNNPHQEEIKCDEQAVKLRREKAGISEDVPVYAIALSGGGIRSATFSLGLLRALAKNKILHRFDYMSTVSGGGYIGGAVGRLYDNKQNAEKVEEGLKDDRSLLLWWLRNNGRYLIPAGLRDKGQAIAYVLRGLLASHFEAATLILFLAALTLWPTLFASLSEPNKFSVTGIWLWLALLPALFAAYQISAYWLVRPRGKEKGKDRQYIDGNINIADAFLVGLAMLVGVIVVYYHLGGFGGIIVALFLIIPMLAAIRHVLFYRQGEKVTAAEMRLTHTERLSYALGVIAVFLFLFVVEVSAYALKAHSVYLSGWLFSSSALMVLIFRLGQLNKTGFLKWLKKAGVFPVLSIVGYAVLLLMLIGCVILLRMLLSGVASLRIALEPHWIMFIADTTFIFLIFIFFYLSKNNIAVLNLSSMHNLYRARLERAYVSVGNYAGKAFQGPRFPCSPLMKYDRKWVEGTSRLTETRSGDDVSLGQYRPHLYGGPIHLINCCINQTVDDRTGNYNADRKGVSLTLSALGVEIGTSCPQRHDLQYVKDECLSKWLAISGAAAATGMGSRTKGGIAALLFISGLRLGYWNKSLLSAPGKNERCEEKGRKRTKFEAWASRCPRQSAIVGEMFAQFPGLNSENWYISDGGHFDNTGVYALLKRRVSLIVLADCGADPAYGYEDVENLVRKAKIDYATFIEFVDNTRVQASFASLFTTPEMLTTEPNPAPFLLARVVYPDRPQPGVLIVVKPHLVDPLPLDVDQYAKRNHVFPQQTTGDQFFDEAQWEAYHQLGLLLGESLTEEVLAKAHSWI
ncbi:patatin-like phospholipase family protein [Serratia plymuthica]|uniref:patatin-like phospholipase family protein n=1 Tax=Serratia plymuthica TaxID=82996 RepID=UPI001BAEC85C|nr:patatin-like phospholipase family protein [Serratia plymuthica]QUY48929.1 patatin-like phospholipase family protein [Serratia plymuthica]